MSLHTIAMFQRIIVPFTKGSCTICSTRRTIFTFVWCIKWFTTVLTDIRYRIHKAQFIIGKSMCQQFVSVEEGPLCPKCGEHVPKRLWLVHVCKEVSDETLR